MAAYFDPEHPGSFGGVRRLAKAIGERPGKVAKFLETSDTYTLHRDVKRPRQYRKTIVSGPRDIMQADLKDVQSLKKYNNGYRYLFFCIDAFSRLLSVVPIYNKRPAEIIRAFKKAFKALGTPRLIHTDRGREFTSKAVLDFLLKTKIKIYHTNSEMKAAIVERCQRTLMSRLYRLFTYQGHKRYVNVIAKLVNSYNASGHSSLGNIAPRDVNEKTRNILDVCFTLRQPLL